MKCNPCGSWLASDEAGTSNTDVECQDAIAGKPAPTGFCADPQIEFGKKAVRNTFCCQMCSTPLRRRHYWLNLAASPRKAFALHVLDLVSSVFAAPVGAG
ncbi:hypothetical protein EGJ53_05980 [Pseudomonas fluorescens]|nr:hypothetical protein EGJ53_05980 [Pseudomonas fluorescens]